MIHLISSLKKVWIAISLFFQIFIAPFFHFFSGQNYVFFGLVLMNTGGSGGWSDFPLDTCLVSSQISPCCSHTHTSLATHDDTTFPRIRTRSTSHTLVAANTRSGSSSIMRLRDHSHFQEQQQERSVTRQSSLCCRSKK